MPSHRSGLRLSESHILGGSSKAELPLESETQTESYSFGEVTVNIPEMLVKRNGRPINLPLKEFRIVAFMLKHPGRVIGRDELLNEVWGYQNYPCTRTVDNHILRIRQKLEPEPSNPKHFLTIHSAGYKFLP
jgi:DNA-binding response OmpR family regulator